MLLDRIRSRGHWRVVFRPSTFDQTRVQNIAGLYPIIQKTAVELRGWDFPHVDPHSQPHIDVDWVGQESEWEQFLEVWRFYKSGQFVDISGMQEDWRDQSSLCPPDADWKPGLLLGIGDALFSFTEIFEFAARLALTEVGDDRIRIEVTVSGLNGRRLWVDLHNRWPMMRQYEAAVQALPYSVDLLRAALVAEPKELALDPAMELFRRFGWSPTKDMLRELQSQLRRYPASS